MQLDGSINLDDLGIITVYASKNRLQEVCINVDD